MSKSVDTDDLKTADLASAGVRGELLESLLRDKRHKEKCDVISTSKSYRLFSPLAVPSSNNSYSSVLRT